MIGLLTIAITACSKHEETGQSDIDAWLPKVKGNTLEFDKKSPILQKIQTIKIVKGDKSVLKLPGHLVWDEDHTARISPPVSGRLQSILVEVGAKVSTNQPLAYLNAPDIGVAQADAAKARIDLAQAERNYARNKELADAGIIAGKELELANAELSRMREEAQRTTVRIKSLGGSSNIDQQYIMRSPINGIVVERNTTPGLEWNPGQNDKPLFIISDPDYLWVWIDAPEANLNDFRTGQIIELGAEPFPNQTFQATVDFVGDALDPVTRTLKVRAKIHNAEHLLKSEMYVQAYLKKQNEQLLDIPAKAVFLKDGVQMVFVRTADGIFQRRQIQPVTINSDWVSIKDGLANGDEVVLDGSIYLEKVIEESNPNSSAEKSGA